MKLCTECGACFDDDFDLCAYDGGPLEIAFEGSRVLDGRYRLDARMAGGGMGVVFRATHLVVGSTVAVKLMHREHQRIAAARFHREAQILGQIKHPNAVLVMDFGVERRAQSDMPYLVTEFLDGESLARRISTKGRMTPAEAERIVSPICDAVEEAHRIGVVHRDIKPSNIFLERTGAGDEIVKVLDFGIAKFIEERRDVADGELILPEGDDTMPNGDPTVPDDRSITMSTLTRPGMIVGTLRYMAPEQLRGEPATPRSDVYAIATLLYELLEGRAPFAGDRMSAIRAKLTERPLPVEAKDPLSDVLMRALSPDPSERPERPSTLANALREVAVDDTPKIRDPALALAVQLGAACVAVRRLGAEIETWVGRDFDELSYLEARDRILALEVVLAKVLRLVDRCPSPIDPGPLGREIEDFDEATVDLRNAVRSFDSATEYLRFLAILGEARASAASAIVRRVRRLMGDDHLGSSDRLEVSAGGESRLILEDLTHRMLSTSPLESLDALESMLVLHLELVREHLMRASPTDALLCDLLHGLFRHVDRILLRELYPTDCAPEILPAASAIDGRAAAPFRLLSALFAGRDADLSSESPEVQRALWRCLLLHPQAAVRSAARAALDTSDLWIAITYERTPILFLGEMLERLIECASGEHVEIFFLSVGPKLSAASNEELADAFQIVARCIEQPACRNVAVFESIVEVDRGLRRRCANLNGPPPWSEGYPEQLAGFVNEGAARGSPGHMAGIPLAVHRDVARRGNFISFYISHTVDAIARETLPHLLKLDDVTPFLRIPTINRSVLVTLAGKRHFFRKEAARVALVHNPKTPAQTARRFLPMLSAEQLRGVVEDRAVGADVKHLAKGYLERLEQLRGG